MENFHQSIIPITQQPILNSKREAEGQYIEEGQQLGKESTSSFKRDAMSYERVV
jgi:hypothetical protein